MSQIKAEEYTAKEVYEAIRYDGTNAKDIAEWTGGAYSIYKNIELVNSSHGAIVNIGDYIIDTKNTFSPLRFCRVTEQYLRENYNKV